MIWWRIAKGAPRNITRRANSNLCTPFSWNKYMHQQEWRTFVPRFHSLFKELLDHVKYVQIWQLKIALNLQTLQWVHHVMNTPWRPLQLSIPSWLMDLARYICPQWYFYEADAHSSSSTMIPNLQKRRKKSLSITRSSPYFAMWNAWPIRTKGRNFTILTIVCISTWWGVSKGVVLRNTTMSSHHI